MIKIPLNTFLLDNEDATVGTLSRLQTTIMSELMYKAGADGVLAIDPDLDPRREAYTDEIHIIVPPANAVAIMCILANFHPDETRNRGRFEDTDSHIVRAWWD